MLSPFTEVMTSPVFKSAVGAVRIVFESDYFVSRNSR
jgi:hypothetical protein